MRENNRSDVSAEGCFYSVAEEFAVRQCHCSNSDLAQLQHLSLIDASGRRVRMFLRGEVRYLRNLRRKEHLERHLAISLKRVNWKIRRYLLGDYLTQLTKCETPLERIEQRRCVLSRVKKILKKCPRAHPDAAFDFCVAHPGAGHTEFRILKDKLRQVFRLEGRRILANLPKDEREKLKDGPLADVLNDFEQRDSDELVRCYLRRWFGDETVDTVMVDPAWRRRPWAVGPEDRVASELKEFWSEKMKRRDELTAALMKRNLSLPENCQHCMDYVNDEGCDNVNVAVAVVDLKRKLVEKGIDAESPGGEFGIDELMHCMTDPKAVVFESVLKGLQAAMKYVELQGHHGLDEDFFDSASEDEDEEF